MHHLPSSQHDSRRPTAALTYEPRARNRMTLCALQPEGDRKLLHTWQDLALSCRQQPEYGYEGKAPIMRAPRCMRSYWPACQAPSSPAFCASMRTPAVPSAWVFLPRLAAQASQASRRAVATVARSAGATSAARPRRRGLAPRAPRTAASAALLAEPAAPRSASKSLAPDSSFRAGLR